MSKSSQNNSLDVLFNKEDYFYFFTDSFLSEDKLAQEMAFIRRIFPDPSDMSFVDLGCGHGRHVIELAKSCKLVIGVDRSSEFIETAKVAAATQNINNVEWLVGNISEFTSEVKFDGALILNTIIGLADEKETVDLFKLIAELLKPNGRICFDILNRDAIMLDFQHDGIEQKGEDFLLDQLSFHPETGRFHCSRKYIRRGKVTSVDFSLRSFNLTEITKILSVAGLKIVEKFGNWDGSNFSPSSKKMYLVCTLAR